MPVRFVRIAGVLAALAIALPAIGDDVVLGLDNAFQVQSNVFKTSTAQVTDGNYEIAPSLTLRRRSGDTFTYDVMYQPSYDVYFNTQGVNGVDHFVRGAAEYSPWRLGRFWGRINFTDYRSVRSADAPVDGIPDVLGGSPGRVSRTFADAGYDHQLTRLSRIETSLKLQNYAFTTANNTDSIGIGGEGAFLHALIPIMEIGGSVQSSFRRYKEDATQPASQNIVVNPNLVLILEPMETLRFDVRAGPAWVQTEQSGGGRATVSRFFGGEIDGQAFGAVFEPAQCRGTNFAPVISGCPLVSAPALLGRFGETESVDFVAGLRPADIDDQLWTAFVRASAVKEESWGAVRVDYFRREDAAAGSGSTTIRDSVTGEILFRPGWRFDVLLRANWNKRRSTSDINRAEILAVRSDVATGDGRFFAQSQALVPNVITDRIEISQVWADVTVGRPFLLDGLRLEARYQYLKQDRADQPITGTFDNHFGGLRLIYRFKAFEY